MQYAVVSFSGVYLLTGNSIPDNDSQFDLSTFIVTVHLG